MAKKEYIIWIILIILALIIGIIIGKLNYSEKSSDRIPPQVKFINEAGNCGSASYFEKIGEQYYSLSKCGVDKIDSEGNTWCSCSR